VLVGDEDADCDNCIWGWLGRVIASEGGCVGRSVCSYELLRIDCKNEGSEVRDLELEGSIKERTLGLAPTGLRGITFSVEVPPGGKAAELVAGLGSVSVACS
jgi:hypothetical protein